MTEIPITVDLKGEISVEREMEDHLRRQIEELLRQIEEQDLPEGTFQIGIEYLIENLGELRVIEKDSSGVHIIEPGIGEQYRDDIGKDYGFQFCSYCKSFRWQDDQDLCFICQEEME